MRNIHLLLILIVAMSCCAIGQNDSYVVSQQGYVSLMPLYQSWQITDGLKFSETSGTLALYTPLSRQMSFTLRGAGASSQGDVVGLSGVADGQIVFSYHLEKRNIIFSLSTNLPTGKKKLTQKEFETSGILSASIFHLQVPNFGTGFSVQPGVIWAMPVNDDIVLGLGASFQYKGKFQPLEEFGDYDPGDEILVTGGVDARLSEGTTLSLDVVYTTYGKDKFGGADVFAAGNKIVVNVQFKKQFNLNELSLFGRYRSKGKNEFDVGGTLVEENEKIEPDQIELVGIYTIHVSDQFSLGILGETRFYKETPAEFTGISLFGFGATPVVKLSDNISAVGRFKYLTGKAKADKTLTGVEAGLGLRINF